MVKVFLIVVGLVGAAVAYGGWRMVDAGFGAIGEPGRIERLVATTVRNLAVGRQARSLTNPVELTGEALADARAHFADHCASCHANDGSGDTELGRGMWPPAPDMRLPATQDLTDGQLFWIIEHGVRFTGMPGWTTGTPEGETASWQLVHFIRRLPSLTVAEIEEMEALNPRSIAEVQQRLVEEAFLAGEDPPVFDTGATHQH
ncbi:MAG: cytochrome c [Acidimicrobiia bacterium]|nr:cytochrome c [Acidimicrobiia bacterium]